MPRNTTRSGFRAVKEGSAAAEQRHEATLRSGLGVVPGVWAGRKLGFGRNRTLDMLRDGTFPCPVMRSGRKYVVSAASLRRALDLPAEPSAAGSVAS